MMKKLLICLLLLSLVLAGCSEEKPAESEPTTVTTEATEPAPTGIYAPGSAIETATSGAVRLYNLTEDDCFGICGISGGLLTLSGQEQTRLTVYENVDCIPVAELILPVNLRDGHWQSTATGIAYYDSTAGQAVYLNSHLQEMYRIDLPQDMRGAPAFTPDASEIYYCTGQEIRGLDTERSITRLIKSHSYSNLSLQEVCFDGKLLRCHIEEENGKASDLYLLTENGTTVYSGAGIQTLCTFANRYIVSRMDGTTTQYLTGTMESEAIQWNVDGTVFDALSLESIVGCSTDENGILTAALYAPETGCKTASVELGQLPVPVSVWAESATGCLWLLMGTEGGPVLLRWDAKQSAVTEETVYSGPVRTAEAPDTEGLASLQERVDDMNDSYGVTIRIWEKAVATTGDHVLEAEYQVPAIEAMLDKLEPLLQMFPESFLRKSANTRIRICVVRSANGSTDILRFWDGGDPFVVLPVSEAPEQDFLLALSYIVDSHILGNSPMVDDWEQLNPEGFTYGSEADGTLLEGESRAFADEASMQSVADERARIFWYALQPDKVDLFASPVMQEKLLLLCRSIRDAWRLERKSDTYLWEQYLTESIAYNN